MNKIYQVSTIQALASGYFCKVISVKDLLLHGDTGLGTFTDLNGEMILLDGRCYQALGDGRVVEALSDEGVPFASVGFLHSGIKTKADGFGDIEALKTFLDRLVAEDHGKNSIYICRIDGEFRSVSARAPSPSHTRHVSLSQVLSENENYFIYENIRGSIVCIRYPGFLSGINIDGWHLHFISDDRSMGGHVFDLRCKHVSVALTKTDGIEVHIPEDPEFDTYSLCDILPDEIKKVEQKKV